MAVTPGGQPAHFQIDGKSLGGYADEPNPGPKQRVWHKGNIVEIKQIPGKGKKFVTVRTSDKVPYGTLWELELTIRSVTTVRYEFLKGLIEDGGPFEIFDPGHGQYEMYCVDGQPTKKEGDSDPPVTDDDGNELNVAEWVLKFVEAND